MTRCEYLQQTSLTPTQLAIQLIKKLPAGDGTFIWATPGGDWFGECELDYAVQDTIKWLKEEVDGY